MGFKAWVGIAGAGGTQPSIDGDVGEGITTNPTRPYNWSSAGGGGGESKTRESDSSTMIPSFKLVLSFLFFFFPRPAT